MIHSVPVSAAANAETLTTAKPSVRRHASTNSLPATYACAYASGEARWYDLSLAWFQNFEKTALDPGDQVRIYGLEPADPCAGTLAILAMRQQASTGGFLSPKTLSSLSNFYSITFGPIGPNADVPSSLQALVEAMVQEKEEWDAIELRPLERDSPSFEPLNDALRKAGMLPQNYFCFGNWYLPSQGLNFAEYFKTLAPAMQNTIRRRSKKLEKTGRSRIEIVSGPAELEAAIAAYESVYLTSWKRPEPYPEFMPHLIRMCAEKGWLRLGLIHLDDQPIAAQMWIVNHGRATIYKLGHDQRADEYSAGSILTSKLLEHVLEIDKVQEIDFGSGDDAYKKTWLPLRRERWGILAMNPRTPAGCALIAKHVGGRAAKKAWHFVRGRRRGPTK